MEFTEFDESIGVEGYFRLIMSALFPKSTPFSFDMTLFKTVERNYPKGSAFSRVRKLNNEYANNFLDGNEKIKPSDFYPPKPYVNNIPEGRFNKENESILYLADNPFIAMKECDIMAGDYFLLSYFSLKKDACFLYIENNIDPHSSLLYRLLNSRDKRFYPVINLIYSELLTFDVHNGIAYDSIKYDKSDSGLGEIKSNTNFAIGNEYSELFKFEVSWLMQCMEDYTPLQLSIYYPSSNVNLEEISSLNYSGNEEIFGSTSHKMMEKIWNTTKKNEQLIQSNEFKTSPNYLFKTIKKY